MYSCYIELGDIHILQAALVFVFYSLRSTS